MKIYYFTGLNALGDDFIEKCTSFFPQWRKDSMLRFRHQLGRKQNAVAYLLLIHALKKESILNELPEFEYNEHEKPFLKNYPQWNFNVSHSRTAVACVLSKEVVGIDIQEVGMYKESLAAYSCSDDEMKMIHESENPADEFYCLWTKKEAVFKCLGTGITDELKTILQHAEISVKSWKTGNLWLSVASLQNQ